MKKLKQEYKAKPTTEAIQDSKGMKKLEKLLTFMNILKITQ